MCSWQYHIISVTPLNVTSLLARDSQPYPMVAGLEGALQYH